MVIAGNVLVLPVYVISNFVPCGLSRYFIKHSALFQVTKQRHEIFTMKEKIKEKMIFFSI